MAFGNAIEEVKEEARVSLQNKEEESVKMQQKEEELNAANDAIGKALFESERCDIRADKRERIVGGRKRRVAKSVAKSRGDERAVDETPRWIV